MSLSSWHYPRKALSDRVFRHIEEAGGKKITFFAERRKGKTEFLLRDLQPEALKRNYTPVYVNFWDQRSRPDLSFMSGLVTAIDRQAGFFEKSLSKLELGGGGITIGAEFRQAGTGDSSVLSELNRLVERLTSKNAPVLLLLDEIQHLATNSDFDNFTSWLRTALDTHGDKIYTVFTGSSRDGLNRLFRQQKAPFFHASDVWQFDPLDDGFVDYILDIYKSRSGRGVSSITDAREVFERFNRTPEHFVGIVRRMLDAGVSDILVVTEEYERGLNLADGFNSLYSELKAVDQILLKDIASKTESLPSLYSDENKARIADMLGLDEVSTSTIQNAIQRLRKLGLIFQADHGAWQLEDEGWSNWFAEQS